MPHAIALTLEPDDFPVATRRTIMFKVLREYGLRDRVSDGAVLKLSKSPVIAVLLVLSVACGSAAAPTLTPSPDPTATPPPTLTPVPEPPAPPLPTSTPVPQPTATPPPPPPTAEPTPAPAVAQVQESPSQPPEQPAGDLHALFPEISEKMKDIRPVYTAYYHREDWQAPGHNTTVNQVFELLKMENIVSHQGYQPISPATVVEHEPDLIIANSTLSVVDNPALAGLHMVTDTAHIPHHIFVMRFGYSFDMDAPGFRDTVEAFAAFAYPDTFTVKEESMDDHGDGHDGHDHGDGHSHTHGN